MTNRKLLRPWDRTEWTMLGACPAPPGFRGDWYEITNGNITVKVQRSELERSYIARRNLIVGGYAIGDALRTYLVEYRIVERTVDPLDWCEQATCPGIALPREGFGGTRGHAPARNDCTVYAYDMDGRPLEADCCSACVLQVIDSEHDTDPSRKVIVERSVTP